MLLKKPESYRTAEVFSDTINAVHKINANITQPVVSANALIPDSRVINLVELGDLFPPANEQTRKCMPSDEDCQK